MPTYAYKCARGHTFERFQKMSDPPEARCPECGRPGERQISGGAGLIFKGSGFYITDYKRAEEKRRAGDEKPKESKGEEKPGSSTSGSDSSKSSKESSKDKKD